MKLLNEVKNFLDITWELSVGESEKLSGIIERGKAYIEGKVGACNFEDSTQEKELLMNYCMYARAGQIHEFMSAYKSEIISLQMKNWHKKKGGKPNAENQG